MSFDMNISTSKPVIREAQSMHNDGGGGNLGYMSQGEKEDEEKQRQYFDESIFNKKPEIDTFSFENDYKQLEKEENFSILKLIKDLIKKIFKV